MERQVKRVGTHSPRNKEVPLDQLEYYLNTELSDEKCFVLKK